MGGFNPAWFISVAIALVLVVIAARDLSASMRALLDALAVLFFLVGVGGLAYNFHALYKLRWPWVGRQKEGNGKLATLVVATEPGLKISMSGANVFVPDEARDLTGIALDATVWNTGTPTRATEWNLAVIPQGKRPVIAQLTAIPEFLRLGGAINSGVIRGSDALDQKTLAADIGNSPISGKLLFYVPMKQEVVLAPSTRLELSVKDINKKETIIAKRMGDWLHR
jgi:hypothetical protein